MLNGVSVKAILFGLLFLWAGAAAGGIQPEPRVSLVESASVHGEVVTLADLLPNDADALLRRQATDVVVALAPQPGSVRVLTRGALSLSPRLTPELLARIAIPERITLTCAARAISRKEIAAAIRRALEKDRFADSSALVASDVVAAVPVFVTSDDPGLEVLRTWLGRTPGSTSFELWTSSEPKVRPFDVVVRNFPALAAWLRSRGLRREQSGSPALLAVSRERFGKGLVGPYGSDPRLRRASRWRERPSLVVPGKTVSLVLASRNMRVHTSAMPLQRGSLDQWIRVRNLSTGQILNAQVVGPGTLEAVF